MPNSKKTQLFGSDPQGKVYDYGDKIVRQIEPSYFDQASRLYSLYKKHHLLKLGLVQTTIDQHKQELIHEKHPISYPHEWTYTMFKDSLIFQLELVYQLDHYGLTLKDFLPNNVVFDYWKPIFVDFLSLIPSVELENQKWLFVGVNSKKTTAEELLFSKMFIPHLLIPLFLYAKRDYAAGRKLLETKACNLGNGRPTWRDIVQGGGNWDFHTLRMLFKSLLLSTFPSANYLTNIRQYIDIVKSFDISDLHSAYLNYYLAKGENYSLGSQKSWKKKQNNIYQIIHSLKPRTTLDIGANTGWYSLLAEKEGSSVIATDIDEGTIDHLYLKVKKTQSNILPLVLPFSAFIEPASSSVYLPAISRFRSELVLCLALIHHLVLGQGITVGKILKALASLSERAVILEYVDLSDEKIIQDPSFFPQLNGPASHMYNLAKIVKLAKQYFRKVEIMDSTEVTRKLLVLYH